MATRVAARRPMGVADLLDETFRLYRQHFGTFVALTALFLLPQLALNLLARLTLPSGSAMGLQIAIGSLGGLLLVAAMVHPGAEAALGATPSVGGALRCLVGRLGPVLVSSVIYLAAPLLLMATLVGIPFGIYFLVAWGFVYQAVLLEELGVRRALGRSRSLVRGSWWRVFGIGLLVGVLVLGIAIVLSLPAVLAQGLDRLLDPASAEQPTGAGIVLEELSSFVAQVLANPIAAIAWTLLYYDLRMRKEGLDLEMRARELAGAPPLAS